MRTALVLNPASGSVRDPQAVVDLLQESGASEVVRFACGEEAAAVASGADRLIVAGGDGTIGPSARAAADAGVPLGVLPAGTANDFARALGLPLDLAAAARVALAPTPSTRPAEVCLTADDRPFVNAANAGLAVRAAREASGMKARLGPLAYMAGAVRAGLRAPAIGVQVTLDGRPFFDGEAWQVSVSGTGRFGGGSAVGETDQDDGLLDVTIVPAVNRRSLVRRAYGLRRGTLGEQHDVPHERARRVRVHLDADDDHRGFNVDGELVVVATLEVHVHPRRVAVIVP
ncbi:diacylglycerol/lipid kinase family protein [Paraconexibacter algicola]|uniref:DAGKc domain-containing protein n=1 Tax=Paraconexibacter algicola TaxID=2133960 RepID=A0A2T4UJD2_9ACTN|nr:diacylglycerol kinase family protein [Paraconexibacter algicola]PTL59348.1 hypothetical protein C7Y72_06620 [Paraconexibacter algicola]